ncbi:MAG: ABC transporter permease [Ignavibacteria bacterium]|jgi:ABC-type lipoprotein release transport system permease subunit|nr:ABC transporter permease [Ignavibacteria bacterium]
MLILKLAFRNITHAGLRSWLNVFVLSFAFVMIVMTEGLYDGMLQQVKDAIIDSEIGGGQFFQKNYDPYDPFSIENSHSKIPENLQNEIKNGNAAAVLIVSAAIFPKGHVQSALLKGIDPMQKIVKMPTWLLKDSYTASIPGLIGSRMAESMGLQAGDYLSIRWKNINGTFDAADVRIVEVMNTDVQSIDRDQIWVPLNSLQKMYRAPDEATIITLKKNISFYPSGGPDWAFKNHDYLLKDLNNTVQQKKTTASFMFILLLGMALLAVFDTQVLAIFRRRKEMGTLMALGMTRWNVIMLFTLEGCLLGILALIAGAAYGIPLLAYFARTGLNVPQVAGQAGISIGAVLYPKYGLQLYVITSLILFVSVVVVSFLPTRRITKLKPTDALRGKIA